MFQIELLSLDLTGIFMRYYLLMTVVIAAGFSGQWWLGLLALPIFISAILGVKISLKSNQNRTSAKEAILQQRKKAA